MKTRIICSGSNEKGEWATIRVMPWFSPDYTITFARAKTYEFFAGPHGESEVSLGLLNLQRTIDSRKALGLHLLGDAYPVEGLE